MIFASGARSHAHAPRRNPGIGQRSWPSASWRVLDLRPAGGAEAAANGSLTTARIAWRMRASDRHGFTLIELSIVLVIIGLLVGGILVGRDLIKAAEIRAQVAQIVKYNTAINTFRLKYGGMPGDLAARKAVAFGMAHGDGSLCYNDGNDLLCAGDPNDSIGFCCENALIWSHLSYAGLIDGSFTEINATPMDGPYVVAQAVDQYFPRAKINKAAVVHAFGQNIIADDYGRNFWFVGGLTYVDNGDLQIVLGIAPIDLFSIDSKMDDGFPMTGTVVSRRCGCQYAFDA